MKASELRTMGEAELNEKIVTLRGVLSKAKASSASGTRSENPGVFRKTKRDIARVLTIMHEKKKGINH